MSDNDKPQVRVTEYRFDEPREEQRVIVEERKTVIIAHDTTTGQHVDMTSMAEWFDVRDGDMSWFAKRLIDSGFNIEWREEVKHVDKGRSLKAGFVDGVRAFNDRMKEEGIGVWYGEKGYVYVTTYGVATVKTPTELGTAEHKRRMRIVEELLAKHGITTKTGLVLDCRVELSGAVCKPALEA